MPARRRLVPNSTPHLSNKPTLKVSVGQPEVIVDFVFESGLLYLTVNNIGKASAYQINCKFDQTFCGLGGDKELSSQSLFKHIAFMPPGKVIRTFVDHSHAYFERREPEQLLVTITFYNKNGKQKKHTIPHDLSIYRDISYIV